MSDDPPSEPRPLVVHVITKLAVGGAQQTALDLCEGLPADEWDLVLLAGPDADAEGSLAKEAQRRGIRVVHVPHLSRAVRPHRDVLATVWLLRWFRRHRPDIVHTHSSKAGALGRFAAWVAGVPTVVHSVHGWSFAPAMRPAVRRIIVGVERALARRTTRLVVVTSVDRDKGLAAGIGRPDQYRLIHNGIDLSAFRDVREDGVREELGLPSEATLVGTVGRLVEQKNPLGMVDAMASVLHDEPDARFVWVGDGPLRGAVEERVRLNGLDDRFLIVGVRNDVPRWVGALDVFVLSSRWEGLPRTVTEAMAAGVPVVATAVGGVIEAVEDGRTGLLVPPGDPALLADRVRKVLHQPELAMALADAGRARARDFDRQTMIECVGCLYREAGSGRASEAPLRVTHVITGLGVGGAERTLERLVLGAGPMTVSHEVISLGGDGPVGERLRLAGVPVRLAHLRPGFPDLRGLLRLRRLVKASAPDVVQTWLYHGDLVGGLVARSLGLPVVWNIRQAMVGGATTRLRTRIVARACALLSGRVPTAIVSNSEAGRTGHVAFGYGARRFRVIPNGIETGRFRPDPDARRTVRAELGLADDAPVVGMVARVDAAKDHATMLQAVARLMTTQPDLRAVLVGAGVADDPTIRALVDRLGLDDVVVRLRPRDDVERLTAAMDVAVSSSTGEGWPNAVGEAMACGVPVVASDVGDSRILVGDAGTIIPPGDAVGLATAISRTLALDPPTRTAMGEGGRRRILEAHSMEAMLERYHEVWTHVSNPW